MEYYKGGKLNDMDIVRLNTGRAAIYHACTVLKCKTIWLPYYQCETVKEFLCRKEVICKYYHIDSDFNPLGLDPKEEDAVLLVNYYGIMSVERMAGLANRFKKVIIDNSQAFFSRPIDDCMNVYSARKFMGVPDGSYVIGKNASSGIDKYDQGYSSDTALFMLQRIEYGCEGKAYTSRVENEKRLDAEDCKTMSRLTHSILDGTDYGVVQAKRKRNFAYANGLFKNENLLNPTQYYDFTCVPMIYPLLIEDDCLLDKLLKAGHFQGHWWKWVEDSEQSNSFEKWVSKYMIPITIDQRYGVEELEYIYKVIGKA